MDAFLELTADERRALCDNARTVLGLAPASIEKDYWVCWTLRELFALEEWGPHLTFKGGTSLAKCWNLIERFSEDIDVVIDRAFLGFPGARLTQRQLTRLRKTSSQRITGDLLPTLRTRLADRMPRDATAKLDAAGTDEDRDQQTLLFWYPTVYGDSTGYVRPVVRIELGARSDTEPTEQATVQPLLADAFPNVIRDATFSVRAVAARRTFWEKAMLLHEETYRPSSPQRRTRLSRHYYDLWCLISKGTAADAVGDEGLFERVAEHRQAFFRYSWMDYATLRRGTLRLLPPRDREPEWRRDYAAMGGEMFRGEAPTFDEILKVVAAFEREFNGA